MKTKIEEVICSMKGGGKARGTSASGVLTRPRRGTRQIELSAESLATLIGPVSRGGRSRRPHLPKKIVLCQIALVVAMRAGEETFRARTPW